MKHLLLLRHGDADHDGPADWSHDSQRPLTAEGKRKMALEARGMKALGIPVAAIITSPYKRARQTADAVAAEYRLVDRMVESDLLEPGAGFRELARSVRGVEGEAILLVGHAPDLGVLAGDLIGSDDLALGKGSLAWIRLDRGMEKGGGRLKGLLPADLLVAAGRL